MAGTALRHDAAYASGTPESTIAVQLYSIREEMKKDPAGSLALVAEMGYSFVEHANYVNGKFYGFSPKEFRTLLDGLGLRMISGHTVMDRSHWDEEKNDFTRGWKQTVDDAAVLGQQYMISPSMDPSMRTTYAAFMRSLDVFNSAGDLCHARGMKFGYHNHDFEFTETLNGEKLFDIMMKTIDPDRVVMQLDIGNMYNGGAAALDVVQAYPGRFEMIHVKDEIRSADGGGRYVSTIFGEGIVRAKEVLDHAATIGGARVFVVEQEDYQGATPMECIAADLAAMRKWGYGWTL